MQEYETGAMRDTGGKGRMDLLPMCALIRVSKHMENANTHYPERNWENGLPMHTMIDSALRHLAKYVDGWTDEDHLCAAATNLLMALWTEEKRPEMQDIPSRITEGSSLASEHTGGTPVPPDGPVQEKAPPVARRKCESYDEVFGLCLGTKDRERCDCKGDMNDCDFYPEKRVPDKRVIYAHIL
jgi:hypothetical protein